MLEHVARVDHSRGIDGNVTFVDVANDALFVNQESGPISETLLLVEHTIILNHSAFEIAEQWKRDAELFCEFAVGGNTVYTQSEDLSVG